MYLYTLLLDDDELYYDIPLYDIPLYDKPTNKNCISFILSAINKIKII